MREYVIKNCPAFMKPSYCKDKCSYSITNKRDGELTYKFEFDEDSKCQDCTDCVMKHIVELCEDEVELVKKWQEETKYPFKPTAFELAEKILNQLDIQEIE